MRDLDFGFMIAVWGYALTGESDLSVMVAESRKNAPDYWLRDRTWDRN